MKIHTDTLTSFDIHRATAAAGMHGVYAERCERRGSRSRDHSFDVTLRGNSTRRPNWGTGDRDTDEGNAATWDEWGMFIQALYEADPWALIGQYGPAHVFDEATAGRFEELNASEACSGHKWEYLAPMMQSCSKCSAVNNHGAFVAQRQAVSA